MLHAYNGKGIQYVYKFQLNTRGMCKGKAIQYVQVLFRGDINVFMLTIICWFQSPITSSRAGTSSSLEVVITSSKLEMSLRSSMSWYDAGAESEPYGHW